MRELHQEAENQRQDNAQKSANAGESHGLSNKLKADIALARSNGFAHANFARTLRNRHQHDIHHAHAAHQQSHGNHAHHQLEDAFHDVTELDSKLLGAADAKSVRLVRRHTAASAQEPANLVFRYVLHSGISRCNQGNLIILRVVFLVRAVWDEYFHVAGLVQRALLFIEHADHGVEIAIHQQLLALSGFVREEAFLSVISDHHNVSAMKIFLLGVITAFFHAAIHHLGIA